MRTRLDLCLLRSAPSRQVLSAAFGGILQSFSRPCRRPQSPDIRCSLLGRASIDLPTPLIHSRPDKVPRSLVGRSLLWLQPRWKRRDEAASPLGRDGGLIFGHYVLSIGTHPTLATARRCRDSDGDPKKGGGTVRGTARNHGRSIGVESGGLPPLPTCYSRGRSRITVHGSRLYIAGSIGEKIVYCDINQLDDRRL